MFLYFESIFMDTAMHICIPSMFIHDTIRKLDNEGVCICVDGFIQYKKREQRISYVHTDTHN